LHFGLKRLLYVSVQLPESVRMDKWLWAVRLYRSRSMATEACLAGHVKVRGQRIKPSREVHVSEIITAQTGRVCRTVRVLALLDRRVGAKRVPEFLEDLTPPEEYERARKETSPPLIQFPKGLGRPTKKQRRQLEGFFLRDPPK
jgi:ribosome-associated heat shock protein Hsp15